MFVGVGYIWLYATCQLLGGNHVKTIKSTKLRPSRKSTAILTTPTKKQAHLGQACVEEENSGKPTGMDKETFRMEIYRGQFFCKASFSVRLCKCVQNSDIFIEDSLSFFIFFSISAIGLLFYPVVGRSCVICYIRNQIHD
jgi:hypothetical protein